MKKPIPFLAILLFIAIPCVALRAEEDPQELSEARELYKKEVEFATRSIRDRYLLKLDTLKKNLGAKGDFHGALAVEQEMDHIKVSVLEAAGVEKFAGTWKIRYSPAGARTYVINLDGYVTIKDPGSTHTGKGKILLRNSQYLLEIGDGSIERLKLDGANLTTEIFSGKDTLAAGTSSSQGTGMKEARTK